MRSCPFSRLVTNSSDRTLRQFILPIYAPPNADREYIEQELEPTHRFNDPINRTAWHAMSYSPDGEWLAGGTSTLRLVLFSFNSGHMQVLLMPRHIKSTYGIFKTMANSPAHWMEAGSHYCMCMCVSSALFILLTYLAYAVASLQVVYCLDDKSGQYTHMALPYT